MDQQAGGENIEIQHYEENIGTSSANGRRENSTNDQCNKPDIQFAFVHPSDSDVLLNKSDSDDGFFVTDSSDDIMNDVLSDFSPAKDRIEQTRETIMESLVQSFVSVTPDNVSITCKTNEAANETNSTNDENDFDAIDIISVKKDIQSMQNMIPMRRIPSDSAFIDFRRHAGDLVSAAASDEYVTIESASEEPTTVSFFSQSASTSHLQAVAKPGSYVRSKSASSFRVYQRPDKDKSYSTSAKSACDPTTNHWLLDDGWLKKSNSDLQQAKEVKLGPEKVKTPPKSKLESGQNDRNETHQVPESGQLDAGSQTKQESKTQIKSSPIKSTFRATKLPRFYRKRADTKMASSRSESCVMPKETSADNENVTIRRSRSSNTRYSRSPMRRSTAKERESRKDAGGVSYAVKHCVSPDRTSAKTTAASCKMRPQVAKRTAYREKIPSQGPEKTLVCDASYLKTSATLNKEASDRHEQKEGTKSHQNSAGIHPSRSGERNKVADTLKSDELPSNDKIRALHPGPAAGHPAPDRSKLPQRTATGRPMKVIKTKSATGIKATKVNLQQCVVRQKSDGAATPERTAPFSSDTLVKRPTPSLRGDTSPLAAAPTAPTRAEHASLSVSSGLKEQSGAGRSAESAPTPLMSLKVDVSVRAEDGSVHSFRDISPPRDGRASELFSGVEELIRGLLEAPTTACGGHGRPLTATPVGALPSPSVMPRSPGRGTDVSVADRGLVPDVRPVAAHAVAAPRRIRETGGGLSGRHNRGVLDTYAQRLQAEESVVLLTSSGSVSSTDLWPQAARQIVYPLTTIPVISVAAKRSQPRQSSITISQAIDQLEGDSNGADASKPMPDRQKQCGCQPKADSVSVQSAASGPYQDHRPVSPEPAAPSAPPSSPVRLKSASASPDRTGTPSPRSRIPILKRLVSESTARQSRSPTPERRSVYQTARTTPERRRSVTPDSLRSAGGSSGSLLSLKRSPRVAELSDVGILSPFRTSSAVSDKRKNCGRSHSSSPRSPRSSPQRRSPLGHPDCISQHKQMSKRCSPVGFLGQTFIFAGKTADGDSIWTERLPSSADQSTSGVGSMPAVTKPTEDSATDMEPLTSSSGVHSQNVSGGECNQIRHESAITTNSPPTPMKRITSGPFVPRQDDSIQKPIPQKRTRNMSPVRPGTPHPRNEEELMTSSKTSFCSMDSPFRNGSPLPTPEAQAAIPPDATERDHEGPHNLPVIEKDKSETSAKQVLKEGKTEQYVTPGSIKTSSSVSEDRSSSTSSHSFSPRSARSNLSSQHSSDHTKISRKPDGTEQQQERQEQILGGDDNGVTTSLEREMIETENTLRLMEETISVLERQNNSLVTNTKEISEKICQERSRRCDLKTAKLMLQKVRMELQKTTKNSEDNRMQLLNAKEKISEQESAIFLLKESLREECIKNVRMERRLGERYSAAEGNEDASQDSPKHPEVDRRNQTTTTPLLAESSSVRELLEETETLLQEERLARKDVEQAFAQEKSQKLRILNAARKWRQHLETGTKVAGLEVAFSDWESKVSMAREVSDGDTSNMKGYQSIHTPGNSNESMQVIPTKCNSGDTITGGQKFDVESASSSEHFTMELLDKQDTACQCEIIDGSSIWRNRYVEIKQLNEQNMANMKEVQHDRMALKIELQQTNYKLKEETEKKDRIEQDLKNLIEKIHEMQRDVQLYQKQSKEQLDTLRQGDHEIIENLELEKLKLKDYYQQQMETIVQEKVSEFQGKVGHLETVVRDQIHTYTRSMQHKFKEKLATASLQQKEVISRLEAEHSKEVERLTAEYPHEIERLQQRLAECRQDVIDKKNRLEQRETQVGTILRVVKLLIREGNAMKGDAKDQNTVEIARKILRCMDLNLDDIVSPRARLITRKEEEGDKEFTAKDGSCATFRSIPDSPRPMPASRATQWKCSPPVPPRRKVSTNDHGENTTLSQKRSEDSTSSQPFQVSSVVEKKISYTRFGDEVIRAKSEEFLQSNVKRQANHLPTTSDLSQWGDSGSWLPDGAPPVAPPPTPPSVTTVTVTSTSTGTSGDQRDLVPKSSAGEVASSFLKELKNPVSVTVADKGTGSANSLIRDPSFLLMTNSVLADDAARMCQCKRLQRALDEYGRLRMTAAHRKRLKEGPPCRERTRSSSETSVNRLASSYFETIESTGVMEARLPGSSMFNVSSITGSEQQSCKTKTLGPKAASKAASDPNQLLNKEMQKALTVRAIDTGGKFANPFSMRPLPSARHNTVASEKITSKPPVQNISASPSRSAAGQSSSPVRQERTAGGATGTISAHPEATTSRSRQDTTGLSDRRISPVRNVAGRVRKTAPTLKRMPSFDKIDMPEFKESSEDSKFALPRPTPLELKPRDNRTSAQRKQLAAMRKHSPNEKERRHSISPRERKLFTLRSQQHAEKKVTRTEVTKRTLSPAPVSPQTFFPTSAAANPVQTRNITPTFRHQRDRSRSRRRSASSSMDWKKYIKSGQPWQDVYLHEHSDPEYVEPIPTNGTYYAAETRHEDSDRSEWSPSYSWAPPRPGERDRWNRYLTTGQAAEQIALERFYATPERESADARRRMRRSQKQAEVLQHINRLLAVSSGSDPSEERTGRPAERTARRARSHQPATPEHQRGRGAVLDDVRRRALVQLGARHPADPLADLPTRRISPDPGGRHQQQHVSLSLDRELPMPRRDTSVQQRLSSDVKTHQRLAREHGKQRRHSGTQQEDRSASQQRWPSDSRRKVPLMLVSRTVPPERRRRHRSHSHSRYGTVASALNALDMDSWVDQWERKWDQERRQRRLTHWPPT